jgi:membrane protein
VRYIKSLFTRTFEHWNNHDATTLAAALAYYTVLSLAPLLVVAMAIAGFAFRKETVQNQIIDKVTAWVGSAGAEAFRAMLMNVQSPKAGLIATVLGIVVLFISASGVFRQLRASLNRIWEVKGPESSGVWAIIKDQLHAFVMVVAMGFLLLLALLASVVIQGVGKLTASVVPTWLHQGIGNGITVVVVTVIIAAIYRYVPAQTLPWRRLWPGAFATALLITAGKWALGIYFAKASVGSAYGVAGSLVVLLAWIYYAALLFFFGAEFTRVFACDAEGACLNMEQPARPGEPRRAA